MSWYFPFYGLIFPGFYQERSPRYANTFSQKKARACFYTCEGKKAGVKNWKCERAWKLCWIDAPPPQTPLHLGSSWSLCLSMSSNKNIIKARWKWHPGWSSHSLPQLMHHQIKKRQLHISLKVPPTFRKINTNVWRKAERPKIFPFSVNKVG